MTAPVFVVDPAGGFAPVPGGSFVLDGAEGRHAVSVKRLRAGEEVVLTDGTGRWARCVVLAAEGKDRLEVRVEACTDDPPPAPGSLSSRRCPRATGARSPSRP